VSDAISEAMSSIRGFFIALLTLALLLAPPLRAQTHADKGHGAETMLGHGIGTDHHGHDHDDDNNQVDGRDAGVSHGHNFGDHTHETAMMPGITAPTAILAQQNRRDYVRLPPVVSPAFPLERPPRAF